jgi:outer membrane protein OmpA-like peptidoglycan-associated protein
VIDSYELKVFLAQIGFGLGISVGLSSNGRVSTPFHWQKQDFPGDLTVLDASIGLGRSVGVMGAFFAGSGTFPELAVDFTGKGWNAGASAGASYAAGNVLSVGATLSQFDPPSTTKYDAPASVRDAVHFPFGEAELTPEARQILRVMAAQELAVFRSGHASLVVEAQADRVDTEEFNVLLTKCRAFNTVLALQDIVGPSFKVFDKKRIGLGEAPAAAAGDKDNTQNPARRRADVTINGRVVVTLHGE